MELHFQNWYVTRLREAVDAAATTIYVDVPPTITSGILVLEPSVANKREIVYFNGVTGYALQNCVRGLEGTTPNTHNQGATIEQAVTAGQLDQVLSPHILLQGLGNDENAAMSQDAITRVITKSHNTDGTLKANSVTTAAITDGAIIEDKLDFASFAPIYDNVITQSGKTYTITVKGIYMAWGTSSNTSGDPSVWITMNGVIKAKAVMTPSSGNWTAVTAVATGLLDVGQTIVVNQSSAAATDNRSSVGMCLIQRLA